MDEGHAKSRVGSSDGDALASAGEASETNPVVEHAEESDVTIGVASDASREFVVVSDHDDHIDSIATDGEVVFANSGVAAPVTLRESSTFARSRVIDTLFFGAE